MLLPSLLPSLLQRLRPPASSALGSSLFATSHASSHQCSLQGHGSLQSQAASAPPCISSFSTQAEAQQQQPPSQPASLRAVFLGPPGVGKGTYASRVAAHLGVPHVATGDLIREEIKAQTSMGRKIQHIVTQGQLVPDEIIFELMHHRLSSEASSSGEGFILDGFPRTRQQAEAVVSKMHIDLALNLVLREEVLVEKCLGRRGCTHCGRSYNIADIHLPEDPKAGRPAIIMPPLSPPPECANSLETRPDDAEEVIRHRLQVYKDQAAPVEQVFRDVGLLRSFELTQGIPQTLPRLLEFVQPYCRPSAASEPSNMDYSNSRGKKMAGHGAAM